MLSDICVWGSGYAFSSRNWLKNKAAIFDLPGIGALAILLFLNAIAFILSGCTLVAGVEGNKIVGWCLAAVELEERSGQEHVGGLPFLCLYHFLCVSISPRHLCIRSFIACCTRAFMGKSLICASFFIMGPLAGLVSSWCSWAWWESWLCDRGVNTLTFIDFVMSFCFHQIGTFTLMFFSFISSVTPVQYDNLCTLIKRWMNAYPSACHSCCCACYMYKLSRDLPA